MTSVLGETTASDGEDFADRRATRRRRVLKGAVLRFNRGYGALECLVRNESDHGARLDFGDTSAVPARFDIKLGGTSAWAPAEVRWRGMTGVGVELLSV